MIRCTLISLICFVASLAAPGGQERPPLGAPGPPKVDLNTAPQMALETLPGVDAASARKIIAGRPYASVADLSKAGLSRAAVDAIAPLVTVGRPMAPPGAGTGRGRSPSAPPGARVDLNTAAQKDIEALPGVGLATAKKIIAGRPYTSAADLSRVGVPRATIAGITPLVMASPSAPPGALQSGRAAAPGPSKSPGPPTSSAQQPIARPPAPGLVWVNLDTRTFYEAGDREYGMSHGQWMTKAEAIKAGYRASKPATKK